MIIINPDWGFCFVLYGINLKVGSPDDHKIHIGLVGSVVGMGGNEFLVKIARHLTHGYRKNDQRIVNIFKNSVLHFLLIPDTQAESGKCIKLKSQFNFVSCLKFFMKNLKSI